MFILVLSYPTVLSQKDNDDNMIRVIMTMVKLMIIRSVVEDHNHYYIYDDKNNNNDIDDDHNSVIYKY